MKGVGRYAYQLWQALDSTCPEHSSVTAVVTKGACNGITAPARTKIIELPYASELRLGVALIPQLIRNLQIDVLIRPADKIGRVQRKNTYSMSRPQSLDLGRATQTDDATTHT